MNEVNYHHVIEKLTCNHCGYQDEDTKFKFKQEVISATKHGTVYHATLHCPDCSSTNLKYPERTARVVWPLPNAK